MARPEGCICAEIAQILGNHLSNDQIIRLCDAHKAAHAEDAARLAEVERLVAGDDFDPQPWVRKAEVRAALGVTAPTASEAGDERDCPTPGCQGDARYAAPGRHHAPGCRYPAAAEASEVEGRNDRG